ncbi:tellurite resistance TerB family protein, partial [Streptomyces sp. SID7499]|nr:tellurite resistance TerB family protein [Streptomyces sp. SID7499]
MALWDRIKESASSMQAQLEAKKNDLKSGSFRDASMAMCALVAAADGSIDPSERQRVATLISTNDVLRNFPADDLQRRFNAYVDQL